MITNKTCAGIPGDYMTLGAVSSAFYETGISPGTLLRECAKISAIREITHNDITSHFANWLVKMPDFANVDRERFLNYDISHLGTGGVYGYFSGDKLDGIIRVEDNGDEYRLTWFFVNQALQHRGIGQCLFLYALDRFSDKRQTLTVYKNNSPAIHIYQKYGFRIIGNGSGIGYRPHLPHYVMQRGIRKCR